MIKYLHSYIKNSTLAKFTILQVALTLGIYNNYTILKVLKIINISSAANVFLFSGIILGVAFALYLVYGLIFLLRFSRKFIASALLLANSMAFYFVNTYHTCIDKTMIANAFATDKNEVADLLSIKMMLTLLLAGIIPMCLTLVIKFDKKCNLIADFASYIKGLLVLFTLVIITFWPNYIKISTIFRQHRNIACYTIPSNYIISTIKYHKYIAAPRKIQKISGAMQLENQKPATVILVVGETARKANFSLYGYAQKTNPLLEKQPIHVLQNATSCGTSTLVSVPCIFSHLGRTSSEDKGSFQKFPEALQDLGVKIWWKDNNFGGCYKICSTLNRTIIDHDKCAGNSCHDEILLDGVQEYIAENKSVKNLIVLHTNGSHGPSYYKRYPHQFAKFQPTCSKNDLQNCTMQELVNSYDNTILYTDFFLNELINLTKNAKSPIVIMYFSDHGESLGENGLFLHGFPYSIAPENQKNIPFIVYVNPEYKKAYPEIALRKMEKYSHDNVFHSTLRLLSVKSSLYKKELDIFAQPT